MLKVFAVSHDLIYSHEPGNPENAKFTEVLSPVEGYEFPAGIEPFSRDTDGMLIDLTQDLAPRLSQAVADDDFVLVFDQVKSKTGIGYRADPDPFTNPWALIATCPEVVRARPSASMYLHAWIDVEGLAPNFVLEMRPRGPLKMHAFWGHGRFLAKNVIDARNMMAIEDHGRAFQRKEINWKLSYSAAATMEAAQLRDALKDHFLKHVNPKLKDAVLIDAEDDALIADCELEVKSGTPEEFKEAMQWLADAWPSEDTRIEVQCANPGRPAEAYCKAALSDFLEEIVLPAVQPFGFGYSYNDGPSHCKSGYTYGALCLSFTNSRVSSHEAIEARGKFCEWLAERGVADPSGVLERYESRSSDED